MPLNFSKPFIRRPIGTTLVAGGFILVGAVTFGSLPVDNLPNVEFPTISVSASRPGTDPATMASSVAAPLERRLGRISGVTELTSTSSMGSTHIVVRFDLNRNIDGAARDVQAALNAASTDLPSDLPTLPSYRKVNPAESPILILALTSKSMPLSAIYDAADSVLAQRISQVAGIAAVAVSGAEQPAIRVRVNPIALASMDVTMEDVRTAIADANATGPLGMFDGLSGSETIGTNQQLRSVHDYDDVIVKATNGHIIRLSSIATIEQGTRNSRSVAWYNRQPAVLVFISKRIDANAVETAERVKNLLPQLKPWIPASIDTAVLFDATRSIRASVTDMQVTLGAGIALTMLVVLIFLRFGTSAIAAGVTVALSLAITFVFMWACGFSVNNLSLMALAIAVGLVIDDTIVVIEDTIRYRERGCPPIRAALKSTRQIGSTIFSITISLVAALIPLLFMDGIVGRFFREFSVTLIATLIASLVVSLTVTPMICAHLRAAQGTKVKKFNLQGARVFRIVDRFYSRSLGVVLQHSKVMLIVLFSTVLLTISLYIYVPKTLLPQDDTGLVFGIVTASGDTSFQSMLELQRRVTEVILYDRAVEAVGSTLGGLFGSSVNNGRMFIALKPFKQRNATAQQVIDRLREPLLIPGVRVSLFPVQDVNFGGTGNGGQHALTLWTSNVNELEVWTSHVLDSVRHVPGLVDVSTNRATNGLQATVVIDRAAAARLRVGIADIDCALENAFAQRQISTIYTQRNQYRVVLETDPLFQHDPSDLERVYVRSANRATVPLSSVARFEREAAPLAVHHQGQFPSVTITYNLANNTSLEAANKAIIEAIAKLHAPDGLHIEISAEGRAFVQSVEAQPLLIMIAIIAVYIVLGVLYESLVHPLIVISTLPCAGLGALLGLLLSNTQLSIIAFIGLILLIGVVAKNGIMLVDFALEGERRGKLSPIDAISQACLVRFRPILMTTIAATFGMIPLLIMSGPGRGLREPLAITVIGGLMLSQLFTLYTTPVIYLLLDKICHRPGSGGSVAGTSPLPSEFNEEAAE